MGKKSDNAEIAKRIEEVLRVRLDGAQFHDIVQYGSESGWNVSDRQIRKYIARADALLVERQDTRRKRVVARHLAQRMALYARALNAADHRTALAVLDSEAKLRGLYPEKDIKELVKLAATQGQRIEELERRLADAHSTPATAPPPPPQPAEAGPPPSGDAGGSDRDVKPLPLGPRAADG
jgi:hypothetical protein